MPLTWEVSPEEMLRALAEAYRLQIEQSVHELLLRFKPEITNWMKANAPWTDRTGNARQALESMIEHVARTMLVIHFGHGQHIDYGIYLEFSNAGRYAVVAPAYDYFAPLIWREVQVILR